MTEMNANASVKEVLRRMLFFVVAAIGLLALTFVVPRVNPCQPPLVNLEGPVAMAAYWLTNSGAGNWGPVVSLIIVLYLVARPGIRWSQRFKELICLYGVLFVLVGGWIYAENIVKPLFHQPRRLLSSWRHSHPTPLRYK